jgi:hypothetical protein
MIRISEVMFIERVMIIYTVCFVRISASIESQHAR